MAGLTGTQIKTTYGDVLQVGNSGSGATSSPRQLQDGLGNNTLLWVGTAGVYVGATPSPSDANADFNWNPSAAGKLFVLDTTSTQYAVVRQQGGTAGTNEGRLYHDGTLLQILNANSTNPVKFVNLRVADTGDAGTVPTLTQVAIQAGTGNAGFISTSNKFYWVLGGNRIVRFDGGGSLNGIINGFQYAFSNGDPGSASADSDMHRVAAKVVAPGDGAGGAGWIQNQAGDAALAGNYTNATAGLTNTNLSFTVIAGRSYLIDGLLQVSNSTAGEGAQFDFGGGSASATTFFLEAQTVGTNTPGTVVSTSLTGVINWSSVTSTNYIRLGGYLKVNVAGTIILRGAENTHSTGTLTVGAGSWVSLKDTATL